MVAAVVGTVCLRFRWVVLALVVAWGVVVTPTPQGARAQGPPGHVLDINANVLGLQISTSLSRPPTAYQPQKSSDVVAREIVAARTRGRPQDMEIVNSATGNYPLSGRQTRDFKVLDRRSGIVHGVSLDDANVELDPVSLQAAEAAAYATRVGRIEPQLARRLRRAQASTRVPVIVWLRQTAAADPQRPSPEAPGSPAEVERFVRRSDASNARAVRRATTPVVDRLRDLGYKASANRSAPAVYAALKPAVIRQLARSARVDRIDLDRPSIDELDVARQAIYAHLPHANGITGSGARVGIIENGGRIATGNPYLADVTQNTTDVCSDAKEHATRVAGVIGSTHGTIRGIAPGAMLWAGGDCDGTASGKQNAATRAADWGARAVNLSNGSGSDLTPGANERFYDNLALNRGRTVVKSAGNRGAAGCNQGTDGNVTSPGGGYNVLAVGAVDDHGTASTADDTMRACSSWRDPTSTFGDRQKPEVVAPGTTVATTTLASPWTDSGESGTSFAAPMVTGTTALMMHGNSALAAWPEANRAILMATAHTNIEGDRRLSEFDGAGMIDADHAVAAGKQTRPLLGWGGRSYDCSTPSVLDVAVLDLSRFFVFGSTPLRARVAIAWNQADYASYSSRPGVDLDLVMLNSAGMPVATSSTYDNTYEIVDFEVPTAGRYTLRIVRYGNRCDASPKWVAWAWDNLID